MDTFDPARLPSHVSPPPLSVAISSSTIATTTITTKPPTTFIAADRMTRTSHTAHATPAFPVYCVDWADDDVVVLGGGGGASRSGIENKIVRSQLGFALLTSRNSAK